jgi:hypothetical protein
MFEQDDNQKQAPQFNTVGTPCTVPGCTSGKPALRTVGKESFCQVHTPEAFEAAAYHDRNRTVEHDAVVGDFEPEIEEVDDTFDFKIDVEREEES